MPSARRRSLEYPTQDLGLDRIEHGRRWQDALLPQTDLAQLGFAVVLYANAALQASIRAMGDVLGALRREGRLDAVIDRLADFEERQHIVNKEAYDALEERYATSSPTRQRRSDERG